MIGGYRAALVRLLDHHVATVLDGLGATLHAVGRVDAALDRYRAALDLARRAGDPHEAARALAGLAGLGEPAPVGPVQAGPAPPFVALYNADAGGAIRGPALPVSPPRPADSAGWQGTAPPATLRSTRTSFAGSRSP
ncbi:tetratricopeptide repeat protein [Dactylosporangium sucinum]|uniref:Tetratricopeptide repeat protein n=1 Tax=Dactylosporangium sucinum TaxID=1424081 RepID=A0A917X7H8_9ACTN|nr:tetratricopeptide repeat protein [Dactylosporangium sucinum]GGM83474.1 hypothetical protein GCM10007977_101020 [Dactylosporangium sucinum]